MRAFWIHSQDLPIQSVENGEDHHGGEPPGKGQHNSCGVSRHLSSCVLPVSFFPI